MPPEERRAVWEARHEARQELVRLAVGLIVLALSTALAVTFGWPAGWALVGACAAGVLDGIREWRAAAREARDVARCGECRRAAIASSEALTRWDRHAAAGHQQRPRPWTRKGGDHRG
jgi:hypothetical protein